MYGDPRAGPTDRPGYPVYLLRSSTDIELTIDNKPLILLFAQLKQILNNWQFFIFFSFIICFICFKDNLLLLLHQNDDRSCFVTVYIGNSTFFFCVWVFRNYASKSYGKVRIIWKFFWEKIPIPIYEISRENKIMIRIRQISSSIGKTLN